MFTLYNGKVISDFYVDKEADAGVKKIAEIVCNDFKAVTGKENKLLTTDKMSGEYCVIFAQYGKSQLLSDLEKAGTIDLSDLRNKWEVYGFYQLNDKIAGVKNALVIAGSDKRGTIYGMFHLSEIMGVSPLYYFADSVIPMKEELIFDIPQKMISVEPSVKYRGFFINDEWPCFGNWTVEHFGGFTSKMYEKVYELLLRLKGNYLWPAMWSSSFALDGPGTANAEIADLYGVVIGNSHHEPCLRASEEWDKVRGENSIYGNAWNFRVNKEGLINYWRDGLKRSAGWESLVTVGMRGERDSKILGEDATLKDNIDLLKDTIHCQKELIHEAEKRTGKKLPMMLALYKEVEPYYYGDENTEGLCDWDELSDVTLMLCEDNFGYTRTLPDDKMRKHPAGFGMYYHLDYHGGPISYEWINSTPLWKVWEQMSQAYDYGVRDIWIVNVGDLKHNEFPLSYFMNLAYDFEKYGTKAPNTQREYTLQILKQHFGNQLREEQLYNAEWILSETVRLNSYRRPEALNENIYHPCHFNESEKMLDRANTLTERTEEFMASLSGKEKDACYSLFGFQAKAAANLLKLHLYAGLNHFKASLGRKETNDLAEGLKACIKEDKHLCEEWRAFAGGKWKGMEMASHIGFKKWNEDGCVYPIIMETEPFNRPRMQVSASDDERTYDKVYGAPMVLTLDAFKYNDTETSIEIANTGVGEITVKLEMPKCDWLSAECESIKVACCEKIHFYFDESKMTNENESADAYISDGDTVVKIHFLAAKKKNDLQPMTFVTGKNGFIMDACHYADKKEVNGVSLITLNDYGIVGSGVKAYPDTCDFTKGNEPELTYRLWNEKAGEYICEVWFAPTNPLKRNGVLEYGLSVNGENAVYQNTVPDGYLAGESVDRIWSYGALSHRRICKQKIALKDGYNLLTILLKDAGLVAERIYVYSANSNIPVSYMGPKESKYL